MKEFDKIYLSWKKGQGFRRHIVGVLKQTEDGKFIFNYQKESVLKAKEEGFTPYIEFPDIDKTYNGNVLDIFAQRITKSERPDIQSFYSFWEIEPDHKDDKFYMLAHTQGLLPSDNFEFLAEYNVKPGLHFLTELAGLSHYKLPAGILKEGDELRVEFDKTNEHDQHAVSVYKGSLEVGHIKQIHCKIFHKPGAENLKLTVKAVDQNGFIKRAFIKVAY